MSKVFLSSGVVEAEGIVAFRNIIVDDLPTTIIIPALSRVLLTDGNTIDDINGSAILANSWGAGYIRLFLNGALVDSFPPLVTSVSTTLAETSATQIAASVALTAAGGSSTPDATASRKGILRLAGVLTGSADNPALAASGVSPGTYQFVIITVGADGRVVAIREGANTQINNLIGDVVGAPTANQLVATGVNPGIYTNSTITVDSKGRVTFAKSGDVISGREAVRLATTLANIVLSGNQVIDGVLTINGDRILVKDQTVGSENGIYLANAGVWIRSADADSSAEVTSGMIVPVNFGTLNTSTGWILTTANPIILDTTPLTFLQIWGFGGGLTAAQHEALNQLIHFLSDGPGKGFISGAFKETLPAASPFPTSVIWWVDATKTVRIVEKLITYTGILPTTIVWNVYDSLDVLQESATDVINYSGVFETDRTRTIV